MVDLQNKLIEFHNNIKLSYEDNSLLRDYRDQVLNGLSEHLEIDYFYQTFVQGSYSVFTGIKSSDENIDFDIDVALALDMSREDCKNPVTAKKWLRDAMQTTFPSATVTIKNPCVTINFSDEENDEQIHVDIAIYATEGDKYFLARGKEFSTAENRIWEEADPIELKKKINSTFSEEKDRYQFKRCIRYLKRWKDNKFNQENRPTGIGLTTLAIEKFQVDKTTDWVADTTTYNDLLALKSFVEKLLSSFVYEYDDVNEKNYLRIRAFLPVKPFTDTFCKLTPNQMTDFNTKLTNLKDDLDFAIETLDEHEATKKLNKQFGDDFTIVDEDEIVETSARNSFVSDYPSA